MVSDLRSRGHGFDSRASRYKVVTALMDDFLRTGKLSRYITNIKVNSMELSLSSLWGR